MLRGGRGDRDGRGPEGGARRRHDGMVRRIAARALRDRGAAWPYGGEMMVREFVHVVDGHNFGRVRVWASRDCDVPPMDQRLEIGAAIKRAAASVGTFAYA